MKLSDRTETLRTPQSSILEKIAATRGQSELNKKDKLRIYICDLLLKKTKNSRETASISSFFDETEEDFSNRIAKNLEDLILKEDADTIAGFFAEPVMGAGGVIIPPESYFPKIQKILNKHDILMVADEVICGFGRTGNMWGSETFNIKPDIITTAKALSSAYLPISAVILST